MGFSILPAIGAMLVISCKIESAMIAPEVNNSDYRFNGA
jgi:hypothetical protein